MCTHGSEPQLSDITGHTANQPLSSKYELGVVHVAFITWLPPVCIHYTCITINARISLSLSLSLSSLDRQRVVAPSMLTDPSEHSKHHKEEPCVPPSVFVDSLVVFSE